MNKSMEDYISETLRVLLENIDNRVKLTCPLVECLKEQGIESGKKLVWVASGSSYNAVYCAMPFMQKYMIPQVRLITPFEFCYYEKVCRDNIYIFVSQSGYSTNIIEAIEKYQKAGEVAIAVLGNMDSPASQKADKVIEWGVGEESVGYVTKGVATLCLFCMLIAEEFVLERLDKKAVDELLDDIRRAATNHHKAYLYAKKYCEQHTKALCSMEHVMLMSAGANLGTVREGALKMSEMIHVQASFYEAEEYIHGPNLQCNPQYTLFFVDGGDDAGKRVTEIAEASKELTDKVFLIRVSDGILDATSEIVSPLYMMAVFQYIACWAARVLRIDDDYFLYYRFKKCIQNKADGIVYVKPF